jgi:hypothetical protein
MAQWASFPWDAALFANADETILREAPAAAENAYANAAGGFSRFPGLRTWKSLPRQGRVYLAPEEWRGFLVAVTEAGRIYRFGEDGAQEDVTGVPLSGGKRPIFTPTEEEMTISAGGPILRLASDRTEILSDNAPDTTHVAFVDGYTIAIEPGSARFWYSDPGASRTWNDLSVFTAESKPDDLVACIVTPYGELLMAGPQSIEQWERLANGQRPFFKRWSTGEGLAHPYTLVADTQGTYGVNGKTEFVKFQAQVTKEQSGDIAMSLEAIDDWTEAWAASLYTTGQRFVVLQAPHATSLHYGTRGITFLLDYRTKRWSFLHGWDDTHGVPARWPGWSVGRAWGRTFVGTENGITEVARDAFDHAGATQRWMIRSGHVGKFGPSRIDDVRIRLRRGAGPVEGVAPQVLVRMIRDNDRPTRWKSKSLGLSGDRTLTLHFGGFGAANTWQMEIAVTDRVPVEFTEAEILVERLGW